MHEREWITLGNFCDLAVRWGVSVATMSRVAGAAAEYGVRTGGRKVHIISGARTDAEQDALRRRGRPTAPNYQSTHLSCPATGVDIDLGLGPTDFQIVTWGELALKHGLRWGGGGKTNEAGIPIDWPHVDMGPRNVAS